MYLGDPLLPKLFTAVMNKGFKKADISEGISVDGKKRTNLRFADDVGVFNKQNKTIDKTFKQNELRKSESWPKIHKGKTKYMTNHADSEDILTDQVKKKWKK